MVQGEDLLISSSASYSFKIMTFFLRIMPSSIFNEGGWARSILPHVLTTGTKKSSPNRGVGIVALAGLPPPEEFALHSLRIGGATFLARRDEGRWAGEHG